MLPGFFNHLFYTVMNEYMYVHFIQVYSPQFMYDSPLEAFAVLMNTAQRMVDVL